MNRNIKNKAKLVGNAGRDVVLSTFENGNKKTTLVIFTDKAYINNQGVKIYD